MQNLDFEIALVDIKSEADYNAEMEAENKIKSQKMEELKAQLPTIEALAKKNTLGLQIRCFKIQNHEYS